MVSFAGWFCREASTLAIFLLDKIFDAFAFPGRFAKPDLTFQTRI